MAMLIKDDLQAKSIGYIPPRMYMLQQSQLFQQACALCKPS